jgi:Ni/Co efflux regulator RcnB
MLPKEISMRRLFVCAAALGFLACLPASAQNNDHRGDKHDAAATNAGRSGPATSIRQNDKGHVAMPKSGGTMTGDTHTRTVGGHQNAVEGTAEKSVRTKNVGTQHGKPVANTTTNRFMPASGDVHPGTQGRASADRTRNNSGWSGNTQGRLPAVKSQQKNSGWTGNTAGRQFDVKAMRRNMQAPRHFRGGSYRAPQGYQHRHWSYGERLPRGYYARDYWIINFMLYDLFAPPSYLIWVRVGDDALLIDRETGDIVQVRYGVFY